MKDSLHASRPLHGLNTQTGPHFPLLEAAGFQVDAVAAGSERL